MSMKIVRIDELSSAINEELENLNKEVIQKCNEAGEKASKKGVTDLKKTSPKRTDGFKRKYPPGSYAKSWTRKAESSVFGVKDYTIYNSKHYQITHLLEFGYISHWTGKRVGQRPHIEAVNNSVSEQFVRDVEGMKL